MAYDAGLVETLFDDLAGVPGLTERRMFGGLCLMLNGNMLCGVMNSGGFFRVGKAGMESALANPGIRPMGFTGRPMGGIVEADEDAMADDAIRSHCLALALGFVGQMEAK